MVVKAILRALNKPESLISFVKDRPGHDQHYAIDPEKIHKELGWLSQISFEEGIEETVHWYLANRHWWESIISCEYKAYYELLYGNRGQA